MDFFEQQHRARRNTGWILIAFLLAVAGILVSINVTGAYIYLFATERPLLPVGLALASVPRSAYTITTLVVLGAIAWGTLGRVYALAGGGAAVAGMVGARRVGREAADAVEKRLLNIVEEMALASGVGVPRVFVMDGQSSINAFAAGYSPNEAAVIVTEGALKRLNRDEIQGVIAHEFSHILNGDMRLNIRLLGLIAGIVLIGSAGGFLMRVGGGGHGSRGDIRVLLIGFLLWLIGSVGVFAGRLIRAAVSREREFLADASAVQFTRNPDGIGGALYKIAERGSVILERHAEELSHMCIGAPLNDLLEFSWMKTHPPLEERMERLLGPAAKRLLKERIERADAAALAAEGGPAVEAFASPLYANPAPAGGSAAAAIVASIGNPSPGHVNRARRLLEEIPADVHVACGSEAGAKAALLALLLGEGEARMAQLSLVREDSGAEVAAHCTRLADALKPLGPRFRLPVFELALPALRVLSPDKRDRILRLVREIVESDRKVTLGEFVLLTLCTRHLGKEPRGAPPVKHKSIDTAAAHATVVLSLLAHSGRGGMHAFDKGMGALGIAGGVLRAPGELDIPAVERALYELKLLAPLKKPALIKACLAVVMADDKLTVAEGELMRAICAALDTPLPPILETAEAVA
jgi:Zn-dependent protease with chaperone function